MNLRDDYSIIIDAISLTSSHPKGAITNRYTAALLNQAVGRLEGVLEEIAGTLRSGRRLFVEEGHGIPMV